MAFYLQSGNASIAETLLTFRRNFVHQRHLCRLIQRELVHRPEDANLGVGACVANHKGQEEKTKPT